MTIAPRRNNRLSSDYQINKLTYVPFISKQKYTNYKMVSIFNIFHNISHIPIPIILIQLVYEYVVWKNILHQGYMYFKLDIILGGKKKLSKSTNFQTAKNRHFNAFSLASPVQIFQLFSQTSEDLDITRKLVFFSQLMAKYTAEKCLVWKILMKTCLVMVIFSLHSKI